MCQNKNHYILKLCICFYCLLIIINIPSLLYESRVYQAKNLTNTTTEFVEVCTAEPSIGITREFISENQKG